MFSITGLPYYYCILETTSLAAWSETSATVSEASATRSAASAT